jgi:outer membrane receptor protein involved in Fe transport
MEEVVITADFYQSTLASLPGSISVLDSELVNTRGATHLQDLLNVAPNVNFSVGGSRARFVQIRGVGDLEQYVDPKHYPAVGILTDGISLSNIAAGAVLLDVEQVEVLRGPQGTRFGAGALAGVVNIKARDPGFSPEFASWGSYASFDSWQAGGIASGPLTERLRGRVAVQQTSSDGWMENRFLGGRGTQNIDELAARGKLIWDMTNTLTAALTVLHLDADNGYDAFSLDNSRVTLSDQPGRDAQNTTAVGLDFTKALGEDHELKLNLSYAGGNETYAFDEDWLYQGACDDPRFDPQGVCTPADQYTNTDHINRQRDQFSLDARWLGRLGAGRAVLGVFFHDREEDLVRQYFGRFTSTYETQRVALYGEYSLPLGETFSLQIGLRGEEFSDRYRDITGLASTADEFNLTGDISLEWRPDDRLMSYILVSRGARPGSLNTSAASALPTLTPSFANFIRARTRFETERLTNYEIGLKTTTVDERIDLRLAAFYMDRKDAQLEAFLFDPDAFQFVSYLDNADEASNYGIEFESEARLTSQITLLGNLGYLRSDVSGMEVYDLDTGALRNVGHREQAKSPRWQYWVAMRWAPTEDIDAGVSVEGRTTSYFGYYHNAELDGYALLNADAGIDLGLVEVRAFARNLLDKDYAQHGLYFGNDPRDGYANKTYLQRAEPRTLGVMLRAEFD